MATFNKHYCATFNIQQTLWQHLTNIMATLATFNKHYGNI